MSGPESDDTWRYEVALRSVTRLTHPKDHQERINIRNLQELRKRYRLQRHEQPMSGII
jgi:hypothetical protein